MIIVLIRATTVKALIRINTIVDPVLPKLLRSERLNRRTAFSCASAAFRGATSRTRNLRISTLRVGPLALTVTCTTDPTASIMNCVL
jgi:hypothetical protein